MKGNVHETDVEAGGSSEILGNVAYLFEEMGQSRIMPLPEKSARPKVLDQRVVGQDISGHD
jgi:hypothetical protein